MLEKSLEDSLNSKIKPVNPKGNHPCVFTGRTDAEADAPLLWPPIAKSWLTGREDLRAGTEGVTKEEMIGWHHQLDGREFEQTPGESGDRGAWHAAAHMIAKSWI